MKCFDCPDLAYSPDCPAGVELRARCCVDDHIDRRLGGSFEAFEGAPKAREIADREEAAKSRQQRRWEERKGRK